MNSWKLYTRTQEIWDLMLKDIDQASTSIEIEQYSFWDDRVGHRFLKVLEKKHRSGVKIRLICDGWGSYPLFQSGYVKKLQRIGIEIVPFNPVSLLRPSSWFYHLHKKTLIIDSKIAWIGGLGIKKKFTFFKDTMARLEGPIVFDLKNVFEELWKNVNQKQYYNNGEFDHQSTDIKYLINYCGYGKKEIYEQMRESIQKAEKSIYLTTSYFFPDRNFFSTNFR